MVSVEYRNDGHTAKDIRLKFWELHSDRLVLNTVAEDAHGDRITSVSAHHSERLVVSTSLDRRFKAWVLQTGSGADSAHPSKASWQCLYVRSHMDYPCLCSAMSGDGSLLVVGAGHQLSFWHPTTCDRRLVLTTPAAEVVAGIGFSHQQYLVVFTNHHLMVWNLLSCSVVWRLRVRVSNLCANYFTATFAVIAAYKTDAKMSRKLQPKQV